MSRIRDRACPRAPRRRARRWAVLGLVAVAATLGIAAASGKRAGAEIVTTVRGLRVDGQPLLPIGLYYAPIEKFGQLRDMGFTVTHTWALPGTETERVLEESHRLGLKVVIELTDARRPPKPYLPTLRDYVRKFRTHPALLAWYLYDEPNEDALGQVQQGYHLVRELDPHHPTLTVHVTPEAGARFAPYTDIFAVDPYPVPNLALSRVWHLVTRARVVAGPQKPVWAVIQAFAQSGPRRPSRYPTPVELRNMVYQAIIGGATGILYFSYLWEGILEERDPALFAALGTVNRELGVLAPVLLDGVPDTDGVQVQAVGEIRTLTREWGGRIYVIAANMGLSRAQIELFRPPGTTAAGVESLFGPPPLEVSSSRVADTIEPHGVRVYRF